jgi:Uma2 family endonuclease
MRYRSGMATQARSELLTVEDFLTITFAPDMKAELDNGRIRMMAGASRAHDRVQVNLIVALANRLRGSGCRPSASDMGIRTHDMSMRLPDVTVICGRDGVEDDRTRTIDTPEVVIEILSPSTAEHDRQVKVPEYKALPSVETIALIDPETMHMTLWHRVSRDPDGWTELHYVRPTDLELPSRGLTIPHSEIFARA